MHYTHDVQSMNIMLNVAFLSSYNLYSSECFPVKICLSSQRKSNISYFSPVISWALTLIHKTINTADCSFWILEADPSNSDNGRPMITPFLSFSVNDTAQK
jgi:hypothetical protein